MLDRFFNILKDISEIIAVSKSYSWTLSEITKCLAVCLDTSACSLFIYNRKSDLLELSATYGLSEKVIGKIKLSPGEGIVGTSFLDNKVINVVNPEYHPKFKFFKETGENKYKSMLAVPLTVATKCVGVIILQNNAQKMFSENVVETLKSLSFQIANVILNADILQSLADTGEEKAAIEPEPVLRNLKTVSGVAGNPGLAIGKAYIFNPFNSFKEIHHTLHSDLKKEIEILDNSIGKTIEKTIAIQKKALSMISEADASIFYAHILFLEDNALINRIKREITESNVSAEVAVKNTYKEYKKRFLSLQDNIFKDKIMDLKDVLLRLVETIHSIKKNYVEKTPFDMEKMDNIILVAKEILPSDMFKIPTENINGIICEKGGIAAHIAILAKAFDIPALMQTEKITSYVQNNDDIILDCHSGIAYLRPNKRTLTEFRELIKNKTAEASTVRSQKKPAVTKDNIRIRLMANLALISEIKNIDNYGAEGIGLYRTEFLYMIRDRLPSESELIKIFSTITKEAGGKETTIRVLDVGSDKPIPYLDSPQEENPALGCRGIRYLFSNTDILKTHLKAILKANTRSKLKILFPMITDLSEIIRIKKILKEVEYELESLNMEHNKNYQIGAMIEIPSALISLESIIQEVDFVSIGTNDLLQYIFAIDRSNENVNYKELAYEPVFLKLLRDAGKIHSSFPDKNMSVCGEMAGNPLAVPFIVGAGIHELSMPPKFIPDIKKVLAAFSTRECAALLSRAIKMQSKDEVCKLVTNELKKRNLQELIS